MLRRLAPLLLTACVTSTTVTYLPSPDQPRPGLEEGRAVLARFVGLECDRLREAGLAERRTEVVVATDPDGLARSAELRGSTGDERMDGVVGAVAAQLDLGEPGRSPAGVAGTAPVTLVAGYRCADDGGVVATLERR